MDPRKMDKVNKRLQRLVGEIIHKEADVPADVLVTVSRVATTHNLRGAEVWLSIYPTDQAESVVENLRGQLYELQGFLNRALDAKVVPRIRFTVDYGADHAATIERRFQQLKDSAAGDSGEQSASHS
jgi:ribosome-binding factor A